MLSLEVKVMNGLWRAKNTVGKAVHDFFVDEEGDTNLISIVLVLVIVLAFLANSISSKLLFFTLIVIIADALEKADKVAELNSRNDYLYYAEESIQQKYEDISWKLMLGEFGYYKSDLSVGPMMYKYRYGYWGAFDVIGKYEDQVVSSTYGYDGFETYLSVDGYPLFVNLVKGGKTVHTTGLNVAIQMETVNDGNAVKIKYIVKNETDETVTYDIGSIGDIQISSDDAAPIYTIKDENDNPIDYSLFLSL